MTNTVKKPGAHKAFTLLELSIVLVIIGLVLGGVMVGRELILSSKTRAMVTQMEKYKVAVNTFKAKYLDILPGDMRREDATKFGLWDGCTWPGCGWGANDPDSHYVANNDNIIYVGWNQGMTYGGQCGNECSMFWRHLSDAHMIDAGFNSPMDNSGNPTVLSPMGLPNYTAYIPPAKFGGAFIAVSSLYYTYTYGLGTGNNDHKYENVFYPIMQDAGLPKLLTPLQAEAIDSKMDDGKPCTGSVMMELFDGANFLGAAGPTIGACVYNTPSVYHPWDFPGAPYNLSPDAGGNTPACIPEFRID